MLFARLEPVFSFAMVSYGAGLTKMSLRAFALATLVCQARGIPLAQVYQHIPNNAHAEVVWWPPHGQAPAADPKSLPIPSIDTK